jgi:hypothetical protein
VPYFRLRVPSAPAVCQSILAVQSVSRRVERRSKHGIVNASRLPTGYTEDGRDRIFKIDHERTFEIMSVLNPCSGLQHTQVHQHGIPQSQLENTRRRVDGLVIVPKREDISGIR